MEVKINREIRNYTESMFFGLPKKLVFHSTNTYYELMKPTIEQKQKEAYKNND